MITTLLLSSLAFAQDVDFRCSHSVDANDAIGVVPFELKCRVDLLTDVDYDEVTWTFGDGLIASGETASHVYTEPGTYTVAVMLNGVDTPSGIIEERKHGFVDACGVPEPDLTLYHHGELEYTLVNRTSVSTHSCTSAIAWTVHEGTGTGGKVIEGPIDKWEPRVQLPDEGVYTVVLNIAGIGGTGAAKLTFDATGGLGDGFDNPTNACSTGGGVFPIAGALTGLLLVGRRRKA